MCPTAVASCLGGEFVVERDVREVGAQVNLRQPPRAVWAGGALPPVRVARDLLAHATPGQ